MTATTLAAALLGKPVTPERVRKCLRHLRTQAQYEAFLLALPVDQRAAVDEQLAPMMAQKVTT